MYKIFTMKFITNEPVVIVNNTIVIGDLHLGIEYEFYKAGFSIPSNIEKIKQKILQLAKENSCKKLVLLGDVKHEFVGISYQEEREIPKFLKSLSTNLEVHIVPGNHDGNLKKIVPKGVYLHPTSGFLMDFYFFNHGHSWPDKKFLEAKVLIMGHNHPAVEFKDSLGYRWVEPCWLRGSLNKKKISERYGTKPKVREAIIVPAFNPLVGGLPVNRAPDESLLGPLMTNGIIELKECDVHLLDGTHLGKVKNLTNIF